MDLSTLLSPHSGPLWGAFGVVATQAANWLINRKKTAADATAAALRAVNEGNKQLVDGLFQQVNVLTEQVATLREHIEDCERRHKEANARIAKLEKALAELNASDRAMEL